MPTLSPLKAIIAAIVIIGFAGPAQAGLAKLASKGTNMTADSLIIQTRGSAGTQNHLARRLQRKLRRRAQHLGINPNRIYVSGANIFQLPVSLNSSTGELDRYLRRRYK